MLDVVVVVVLLGAAAAGDMFGAGLDIAPEFVAGGVVAVPEEPDELLGVAVVCPVPIPPLLIPDVAGAVLPGEAPGCVTTGAFGAPVGAGVVCAQARPAETITAAEARNSERISLSSNYGNRQLKAERGAN